jgi:hypothetical protein
MSTPTQENKNWLIPNEPLTALQNLINGCLVAQNKGAFSFEESSVIWESIKFLVELQVQLRESNQNMNEVLKEELSKPEDEAQENLPAESV